MSQGTGASKAAQDTGGSRCPHCGSLTIPGYTHACVVDQTGVATKTNLGGVVNTVIDYEKLALQEQVRGLISYVAELRKHLHHHVVCLRAKNRWHLRSSREECDMCIAELADCERLLAKHYKSGTVD